MIIVSEDRIAQCNELIRRANKIVAYIENCEGCCFNALVCVNEDQAETIFDEVLDMIKDGETLIDFTKFDLNDYDYCVEDKKDDIQKVDIVKAISILRERSPWGMFYCVVGSEREKKYIAIDNHDGEAYTEIFSGEETCKSWLRGEWDW